MNRLRRQLLAWPLLPALPALQACGSTPLQALPGWQEPNDPPTRWPGPAPRVALALSSGGLRGMAHLGVLRVLEAQGLRPDLVVGTSIGALVGACWARGLDSATLARVPLPASLDPWGSWWTSPATRSAALEQFVVELLGRMPIERLPTRFVAVASERNTGCLQLFGSGDVARAVTASSALPGALAPVSVGGRLYVDGGLAAPLPVRVARALGARYVIAVDTTFHAEPEVPAGLIDSVFHAGMVMARHLSSPDRAGADLLIDPLLPPVPQITIDRRDRLVEAGAAAAHAALPQLRALFARAAVSSAAEPAAAADAVGLARLCARPVSTASRTGVPRQPAPGPTRG
jgi:NTE family protein